VLFGQFRLKCARGIWLAVNQEDLFLAGPGGCRILQENILPGMRRKPANGGNLCAAFVPLAKNAHHLFAISQAAAESLRRLPGYNQDGVARVFDIVAQVM